MNSLSPNFSPLRENVDLAKSPRWLKFQNGFS